jgi:hypothetical protein
MTGDLGKLRLGWSALTGAARREECDEDSPPKKKTV